MANYSIKISKEYFNFASSHFLLFDDGSREPLHGHNYRVRVTGHSTCLDQDDMVFDFLQIKPIIREICNQLDHKLLIPSKNPLLKIEEDQSNLILKTKDGAHFSIPAIDILLLPIHNISAERLSIYLADEINSKILTKFQYQFEQLEVEVEESPGQSAIYRLNK